MIGGDELAIVVDVTGEVIGHELDRGREGAGLIVSGRGGEGASRFGERQARRGFGDALLRDRTVEPIELCDSLQIYFSGALLGVGPGWAVELGRQIPPR